MVNYMYCIKCYDDYTTEKVLVMEYIEGTKIDSIINDNSQPDRKHQIRFI